MTFPSYFPVCMPLLGMVCVEFMQNCVRSISVLGRPVKIEIALGTNTIHTNYCTAWMQHNQMASSGTGGKS